MLVGAMLVLSAVVGHYVYSALDDLDDASLQVQAGQIVKHLRIVDGQVVLNLPEPLKQAYLTSSDGYLYALLDSSGKVVAASSDKARTYMGALRPERIGRDVSYFNLPDDRGQETPYFARLERLDSAGNYWVAVAQGYLHRDVYFDTLLTEFVEHIGWTVPLIIALALFIAVTTIRSSLRPITALSARAASIGPQTTGMRLPTESVPDEILPLVRAINSALDRLARGFEVQRQFTANAAHELRTPLAVLTARIGELEPEPAVRELAEDVARMNRLVEQLLRVSRLDSVALKLDDDIDLNSLAAEVISYLAPLAIARGRSLSLTRADGPVLVRGSTAALEAAVRNLIENALSHTPKGTEVAVCIGQDCSIAVSDAGPGVPPELRERIFERFWRGQRRRGDGAGLGLAIVAETVHAHGGTVSVGEAAGGGARFVLRLPRR